MSDNPAKSDPVFDPHLAPKIRAAALMFRDITGRKPLTDREEKIIEERLKKLGYFG